MSVNSKMTAIADAIRNLLDINEIMGLDAMASNIRSITKRGAVAGTISEKSEQYIIHSGYHNGSGTVEISPDEQSKIIAENIKNGVTILGVAGSASGEIYSVIAVTYPEGSVCTCSNGTKTLKARDTSGKALFNVSTGTWLVTATDGSRTKSASVSITAEGQYESVALYYTLYLYNQGDQCVDVTGGWETTPAPETGLIGGTLSFSDREMVLVGNSDQNRVDASCKSLDSGIWTGFKKLCVHVTYVSGQIIAARIVDNLTNKTKIAQLTFSGAGDYNLPLDGISEGQIIMLAYMGTLKVTKIWLE